MTNTKKIKVGITGQSGFIGTHLYNELGLLPDKFERISFEKNCFNDFELFADFVKKCDVIVHLAAVNRHSDENKLYTININLVNSLIRALKQEQVRPHIVFSSSIQEVIDNPYGKAKREGRQLLETWAKNYNASFTGMIIPNVFGPFGLPDYNSFVATFCHKLTHDAEPNIIIDKEVKLIYVSSLCRHIISDIESVHAAAYPVVTEKYIPSDFTENVSDILSLFKVFKTHYVNQGIIPVLSDINQIHLFNTFRSYINLNQCYPRFLKQHIDDRGSFVETIKLGLGGQVSFSTTKPGITRGNHFHTRKIERFVVIKGQARIQLRRIGTSEILTFNLDGVKPSYVDMPVWYTHNITNIGKDDLYTQFWINEWYDEANPDTFFEKV
jgi:UDP-2-acetamido-2,6-beta-L-arabino-hexul-4-ose reductase